MKSFLLIAFLTLAAVSAIAQYVPNNGQVFQFYQIVNPAFAGIENFHDLKLGYRYQWTAFGENSPKFVNLSYNTRIKQPVDLAYNSLRTSNPMQQHPQGIPRGKRIIHGLSVNMFQSQYGVIQNLGGGVNYALHYPIVRDWRITLGAGAYIENRVLDISEVTLRDPDNDPFYNHLLNSSTEQTDINVRAGLTVYSEKFYFGASYLPLVYTPIQSSELAFETPFYMGSVQMGYAFNVNPDFSIKPSVFALVLTDYAVVSDFSVKAFIQNKVWAGVTYRSINSGIAMAGFNFNQTFSVSYAYESSLGKFQQFSGGSHELLLAMRFNNIKKYHQYLW